MLNLKMYHCFCRHIESGMKWNVLQGEQRGTIQRLFWVFHGRLFSYRQLLWCDDLVECQLKIQSEISIGFVDNEAFWNTMRHSNRGTARFDMTLHDCFIRHIEDERIIDVLYRDHNYNVSVPNNSLMVQCMGSEWTGLWNWWTRKGIG